MSEISELKRLAEETKGWDNLKSCWPEETEDGDLEVNWFVGAVTEDDDKYPVLEVNTAQYDSLEDAGRLARYYAAANPAAVLALIAENERLAAQARLAGVSAEMTVHQAVGRAATEALLVMHERDQLKAENERLAAACERAEQIIIVECKAASLAKVRANLLEANRDELRAEVAGLKTGYEAYERVNAELKAEVELLRKLVPSKEIIWCACGDGHAANSYGAGFMDANEGVCANCDAALGQGEQS